MGLAWVDDWVNWLSFYVYRIVPLLSLLMYLVLAVFSESRRREGEGWKRGLVWLAYQLTDWGPAYVIGNLYLETSPREKMIIAFWVPFLLLHNARPDNISAYTIEDNELWLRLIVFVPLQSLGSVLIVYRYILTDCTTGLLRQASIIMLSVGLFKYLESAAALWLGGLSRIPRPFKKLQPIIPRDDCCCRDKNLKDGEALEDEVALLVAHSLFDICKGAFSDYSENMNRDEVRSKFSDQWESMCKVVEMELSLMYDILYTKAALVHTWHGYAIRLASPPLTAAALLLFGLQCKEGMKTEDEVISYVLLVTTFLHDVRWLLRALASTWTHSYFKLMPCSKLKREILCQRRWHKLRHWVVSLYLSRLSLWLWTCDCAKKPKSYRRWAGTFGQRNLLEQCMARNRHSLYSIANPATKSGDFSRSGGFESEDYSSGLEIPYYVKKLVFSNICTNLFPGPIKLQQPDIGKPPKGYKQGIVIPWTGWPGCRSNLPNYCRCVHPRSPDPDERCLGILYGANDEYPRGWICNGANDEYPREWSVEDQATPWLQHPMEQFCNDINNEPPRLPYPWQVCAGMRNASFEQNKAAGIKPTDQSDEDMRFPPELQEAILIWHITTDVFLSCSARPRIAGQDSEEHAKAIKRMSDYMMFLVAKRPEMLPGLTLRSLHEKTLRVLELIWKVAKPTSHATQDKETVATWMLENKDNLNDPNSSVWEGTRRMDKDNLEGPGMATVWGGTQLAQMLLSKLSNDAESAVTKEVADMVEGLKHWIPDLQRLPGDTDGMLKFILDAWVRLLVFASIRCSRDSHARRLSCGGELTTLVWIITEHAKVSVVKKHLESLFLR